jgi:sulfatase maturation enzyme AslB (radical SAM superfamily)
MLLRIRGQANNIIEPLVGKVTRNPSVKEDDSILITDNDLVEFDNHHFTGFLTTFPKVNIDYPTVSGLLSLDHLEEGDLVSIDISGQVNTLYRVNSNQNFLLATERCNSNCLMCSQPPKDRNDIPYLMHIYRKLIPKIPKDCIELGITGGEPTLMGQDFFELLELIKYELPNTELHCLTNGRSFAWRNFTKRLAALDLQQLMF